MQQSHKLRWRRQQLGEQSAITKQRPFRLRLSCCWWKKNVCSTVLESERKATTFRGAQNVQFVYKSQLMKVTHAREFRRFASVLFAGDANTTTKWGERESCRLCCVCCDEKINKICAPVWTRREMTPHGAQGRAGERLCAERWLIRTRASFLVCAQSANKLAPSAHRKPAYCRRHALAALVIWEKCQWIFLARWKEGNKKCSVEALRQG